MGTETLDILRAVAMFIGGLAVAIKVPILYYHVQTLLWFRRGRIRRTDISSTVIARAIPHALSLLVMIGLLTERLGKPGISWLLPASLVVFSTSLGGLLYTHFRDRKILGLVRMDPILSEMRVRESLNDITKADEFTKTVEKGSKAKKGRS